MTGESLENLAFTGGNVDRRSELRDDPALLARLLLDPATRVLELRGGRLPVAESLDGTLRLAPRPPQPDDDTDAVYLGDVDDAAYLALLRPADPEPVPGWRDLRSVGERLPPTDAALAVTAVGIANWHATHTHCPRCGTSTEPVHAGWVRRCPADESLHFPRTDLAVIMAVVDDADRILLARGTGFASSIGMSVLAGFVEPGESLTQAVCREVREEVGVEVDQVRYLGDQPWPFPASLMVGFIAQARTTELRLQVSEIDRARWFSREELDAALADGTLGISPRLSVSRRLIEHWYGGPIDAPGW